MNKEDVFLREDRCPNCGHYLDCASALDHQQRPKPGDISVCMYCLVLLEFNPALKLQLADEMRLSPEEKHEVNRMRQALRRLGPPPSAQHSEN